MPTTGAAWTPRSSLDLLSLPYPFSQVALLTPKAMADAAAQRRITTHAGHLVQESLLEELHRLGLLVPFYRVDLGRALPGSKIDISKSLTALHISTTIVAEVYAAAREGRLRDPAKLQFKTWATQRERARWPGRASGYLYSHHQLLTLITLRHLIAGFELNRSPHGSTTWTNSTSWRPDAQDLRAARQQRSLAIVLTALDTASWPVITKVLRHDPEHWHASERMFPPGALLDWLSISPDDVRDLSQDLLNTASFHDDLGATYDLVRRARSSTWTSLRGSARIAMDQRLAAEVLGRTADLIGVPERPTQPLSLQRLSERPQSLDRVLTEFHLAPHPQVVVGVEGETEVSILARVFELIGLPADPTLFRVVDFNGTTSDLHLLAKFAAEPLLGRDLGDAVQLDRPFTRFVVLTDAENKYASPGQRREQRRLLIEAIASPLPPDLRGDLYRRDARTVEITTWGRLPFEFAHYTDRQIANALWARARHPHPGGLDQLITNLSKQRQLDPTPNVDDAWKTSGVSKPALNEELWPILERRIQSALRSGGDGPPILRAAHRVQDLVYWTQGQTIALTRSTASAKLS